MKTTVLALSSLLALASSCAAFAQNVNVRGTISAFDGKTLSVKARDGRDVRVEVPEKAGIATTGPFSLADLKPGMMLGGRRPPLIRP